MERKRSLGPHCFELYSPLDQLDFALLLSHLSIEATFFMRLFVVCFSLCSFPPTVLLIFTNIYQVIYTKIA